MWRFRELSVKEGWECIQERDYTDGPWGFRVRREVRPQKGMMDSEKW